jgi:hypothetical protein
MSSAFPTRPRASREILRKVPNTADQLRRPTPRSESVDQLCETDRPTNSLTINSLPSKRASLRGGANNRVSVKQIHKEGTWAHAVGPRHPRQDTTSPNRGQAIPISTKRRQTDTMEHPRASMDKPSLTR